MSTPRVPRQPASHVQRTEGPRAARSSCVGRSTALHGAMAAFPFRGGDAMAFRLEEALANHNHASIFATVNIGTPPQPLRLLLDTSAGASWLFGENCSACARRRCLSTRRSSTARETNRSFSLRLRSGAGLEGHIVNESVALGKLRAVGLSLIHI